MPFRFNPFDPSCRCCCCDYILVSVTGQQAGGIDCTALNQDFLVSCSLQTYNEFNECVYAGTFAGDVVLRTHDAKMERVRDPDTCAYYWRFRLYINGPGGWVQEYRSTADLPNCRRRQTHTFTFHSGYPDPDNYDVEETTKGSASADEVQRISAGGSNGTFTITFNGETTTGIAWNATAATVETALEGLASYSSGDFSVASAVGGFDVTFTGTNAKTDVALMTITEDADYDGFDCPTGDLSVSISFCPCRYCTNMFEADMGTAFTGTCSAAVGKHLMYRDEDSNDCQWVSPWFTDWMIVINQGDDNLSFDDIDGWELYNGNGRYRPPSKVFECEDETIFTKQSVAPGGNCPADSEHPTTITVAPLTTQKVTVVTKTWEFTLSGISNDTCTDCGSANATHSLEWAALDYWFDRTASVAVCAPHANITGRLSDLLYVAAEDKFVLRILPWAPYENGTEREAAVYKIDASAWKDTGDNVFTLSSNSNDCSGWPSSNTLSPG